MWFNALRLGFDFQPVFQLLALSLPGSIVQQRKLSMLAEFTCESFNRTVLPFTLEAKGTEACYFQLRQDFRLTKILTLCNLKTCQVCLGLVKLQFYKRKSQLFGGTEVLL